MSQKDNPLGERSEADATRSIIVFSGGAPQHVLEECQPEFEANFNAQIRHEFEHVSVVMKWLTDGRHADVVLLPTPLMTKVSQHIDWVANSVTTLARVGVGVIVREDVTALNISSAENVREVLLSARSIAVPKGDGLTGSYLRSMFQRLGIADALAPKLRHKAAIYGAGDLVARGEADIGLYLASEVKSVPGTRFVGLLPESLQNYIVYQAGVPMSSKSIDLAQKYLKFALGSRREWANAGFSNVD